jgi:3-dehydroquinate synthase
MTRIRVEITGTSAQPYDVVVQAGSLREVASHARQVAPAHRYAVITDDTVAALWAEPMLDSFASAGLAASLITFPAGEEKKTRVTWAQLTDRMLELGFGRDTTVVALGGGVVGDLAGFVAATFMRGLPVIQVPTTLLAMVDASIGGKTGVDAPAGKNLVGAFHQPGIVVIDPEVLSTLPADQLRGGLAEALKHGAIADGSYFDWIVESADSLIATDAALLTPMIDGSVRIKAGFVSADPTETGPRAALNFGHTIGHAIEHALDYGVHHGQCIALGMLVEACIGEMIGVTKPGTRERLREAIDATGLAVQMPRNLTAGEVLDLMRRDKKARQGAVRFSLISEIGTTARGDGGGWTFPVDDRLIAEAWTTIL